jgi:transcription elongation factor GreB
MSRAFTKEDAWEEPVVPPRAALPPGVPNYVTPRGLALLREESAALEAQRARLEAEVADEAERRKRRAVLTRRMSDLATRLASAEVVEPGRQPRGKAHFGARVRVRTAGGDVRTLQVVGVDEADPDAGRIAFLAPIARAILGHAVGETTALRTAGGEERLTIEAIDYEETAP